MDHLQLRLWAGVLSPLGDSFCPSGSELIILFQKNVFEFFSTIQREAMKGHLLNSKDTAVPRGELTC